MPCQVQVIACLVEQAGAPAQAVQDQKRIQKDSRYAQEQAHVSERPDKSVARLRRLGATESKHWLWQTNYPNKIHVGLLLDFSCGMQFCRCTHITKIWPIRLCAAQAALQRYSHAVMCGKAPLRMSPGH